MLKKITASMALGLAASAFAVIGTATAAQADYYQDLVQVYVPDPQQQDKCYEVAILRLHYGEDGRLKTIEVITYTQYKPLLSCVL